MAIIPLAQPLHWCSPCPGAGGRLPPPARLPEWDGSKGGTGLQGRLEEHLEKPGFFRWRCIVRQRCSLQICDVLAALTSSWISPSASWIWPINSHDQTYPIFPRSQASSSPPPQRLQLQLVLGLARGWRRIHSQRGWHHRLNASGNATSKMGNGW